MRRAALALVLSVAALAAPAASHAATVTQTPISFTVSNPQDPGATLTVSGGLFKRDDQSACSSSVMLLVHGLSYGEYAWDFPDVNGKSYSVARALADAGYPAVAIDLPGYGASTKPSGYSLTVESYASMVGQIDDALRAQGFAHVGLIGHSAGTEISELVAGLGLSKVDALVATSYTHVPSQRIVTDFFTGDYVRAATSDYEYFGGTEAGRTEYMYNGNADPDVISYDNAHFANTPSGEIYSIGPQPSKLVMAKIAAPVLLVLAQNDLLFPIDYSMEELALFAGSSDASLHVVPNSGHSFMLHLNAADSDAAIVSWLGGHAGSIPAC